MQQGEAGEWEGQIQGILKEMEARSGNSQELVKKQQEQQEAILNQLMIQQRDTLLKFDEQKKRFDTIQQSVSIINGKFDTQYGTGVQVEAEVEDVDSDGDFFESDPDENPYDIDVQIKKLIKNRWETFDADKSGKLSREEAKALGMLVF